MKTYSLDTIEINKIRYYAEQQNQTDGPKNLIQDIRRTYFKDLNKKQ